MLWLAKWNLHCYPTDAQYINLIRMTKRLDSVREFFGKSITITSGLRPWTYNTAIGGAKFSAHKTGEAVDFVVEGLDCDLARMQLTPHLESYGIRMEDLSGSIWIHIDIRDPGNGKRFFKP